MKKGLTIIEALIAIVIAISLFFFVFIWIRGGNGNYTAEELFMPEPTKAKYQREMVEELRRANDLKERQK